MKAFLLGLALLVGATVIAKIALDTIDMSAAKVNTTQSGNVRL